MCPQCAADGILWAEGNAAATEEGELIEPEARVRLIPFGSGPADRGAGSGASAQAQTCRDVRLVWATGSAMVEEYETLYMAVGMPANRLPSTTQAIIQDRACTLILHPAHPDLQADDHNWISTIPSCSFSGG